MVIDGTIYLDYQASTPMDPRVIDAVTAAMRSEFANPSSEDNALGWRARQKVEDARTTIADVLGVEAAEITFTSGATEANNIGVLGAALNAPSSRRRILVSAIEHKAVLEAAYAAEAHGFEVEIIPVGSDGVVDLERLQAMLGNDVAVVSVMAVNNETGVIQPIKEVVARAAAAGAFTHCDATQALTAIDIDLVDWGVDGASFSSHKAYGPKGIGALYLSLARPWSPRPLTFGGGQEEGLRPGTIPTPLCVGFAEAVGIIGREGQAERQRVGQMRNDFLAMLLEAGLVVRVTARGASRHPGNLHLSFGDYDASDILTRLQPGVAASGGSACTSGVIGPSHVLLAMGMSEHQAASCIRFSVGRFSDLKQLVRAAELIRRIIAGGGDACARGS